MKDKLPDLGEWILPQPNKEEYVPIPFLKRSKCIPFGYKVSEDPDVLDPIPEELNALEQAKKYLKQYSSRKVAHWLTKTTGRSISHTGLLKRIKDERKHSRKVKTLREWARRLEKAIQIAEKIEKTRGYKEERRVETESSSERKT
tara:strand:- start:371 stop:805 length:435 start_codon:yes stop_codon:yes gene_type:complete